MEEYVSIRASSRPSKNSYWTFCFRDRPSSQLDDTSVNADQLYLDNDIVDVSDRNRLVFNNSSRMNNGQVSPSTNSVIRRSNPFGDRQQSTETAVNIDDGPYDNSRHCHPQVAPPRDTSAQRQLLVVSAICLVFMIGEFVGKFENRFSAGFGAFGVGWKANDGSIFLRFRWYSREQRRHIDRRGSYA